MNITKRIALSILGLTLICILIYVRLTGPILVSGKITDADGKPIHEAVVLGEVEAKRSDEDGRYQVRAKRNEILEYYLERYVPKKIPVDGRKKIDVVLRKDVTYLGPVVRKPVIYLYPENPTDVSLKVECSGKLLVTYPEYNTGWKVKAYPDGTLIDRDSKEYGYLFWEGSRKYKQSERQYAQGFVVAGDSTAAFLQQILPKLGLRPKEYNDFIVFWLPLMKFNKWNFIHFRTGNDYDIISKNIVEPKPDTDIRVFMEFKKVEKPFEVEPQSFVTPTRKGFTLVEWGGTEMNESIWVNGERKIL